MTKNGWRDGKISVKKLTVSGKMPVQYIIPKTVAYSTNGILSAKDFNASSTALTHIKLAAQPPYPMTLIVNAGVAGTAGHNDYLTIKGYDAQGNRVEENLYIKGTAHATTCGSKAFAKIDYVKPYGQTSANTTVKSTKVGIGYQRHVGLPYPIASNTDIITYAYDGAYATTSVDFLTISSVYNTLSLPVMGAGVTANILFKSKVQK